MCDYYFQKYQAKEDVLVEKKDRASISLKKRNILLGNSLRIIRNALEIDSASCY